MTPGVSNAKVLHRCVSTAMRLCTVSLWQYCQCAPDCSTPRSQTLSCLETRTTLIPSLAVSFSGLGLHFCISDLLLELRSLRSAFPTLIRLLQIALTVVVTTAHCERSFSALKRIKTYLRSTMTEQRLVDLDEIFDMFAGEDKNRRIAIF